MDKRGNVGSEDKTKAAKPSTKSVSTNSKSSSAKPTPTAKLPVGSSSSAKPRTNTVAKPSAVVKVSSRPASVHLDSRPVSSTSESETSRPGVDYSVELDLPEPTAEETEQLVQLNQSGRNETVGLSMVSSILEHTIASNDNSHCQQHHCKPSDILTIY